MRQLFLVPAIFMLVVILSCSKGANDTMQPPTTTDTTPRIPTNPTGPTAQTPNGLLKKIFSSTPTDSATYYYTYNKDSTLDKLITTSYTIGVVPTSWTVSRKYLWDDQKRIRLVVTKDQLNADSTYRYYFYETSSKKNPSYSTEISNTSAALYYDSLLFIYDAAGNIGKRQSYYSSNWPSVAVAKSDVYDLVQVDANGNEIKREYHDVFQAAPGVDTITSYQITTYDSKKSAYTGIPNPLSGIQSKNNPATFKYFRYKQDGGGYDESDYQINYIYDSKERPVSSTRYSVNNPSDTFTMYFYYND